MGFVLLGLVVLLGAAVGYLHTSAGEELLRARIEQRLGERVTTKATLGRLGFSLAHGIVLEHVVIAGTDGSEAIVVDRVLVVPGWSAIVHGTPTLATLDIGGLHVRVVGNADGTTNLTGLGREQKPMEHIVLGDLRLHDADVHVTRPDGTVISVRGLGLGGTLDARPRQKSFKGVLGLTIAGLTLDKPGLRVVGKELGTELTLDLTEGAGPVTVHGTRGSMRLEREGKAPYDFGLALGALDLTLGKGDLRVVADSLQLAALTVAAARVETHRENEALAGAQKLEVDRIVVDANAVNALAGKRVLEGNVTVGVRVGGPPEKVHVALDVGTPGGSLGLQADVNTVARPQTYDATLSTHDFDVRKVVALETVPEAHVGELTLAVKGAGITKTDADARFDVHVANTTVKKLAIQRADVKGRFAQGIVHVDSMVVDAVGQHVEAEARYVLESQEVKAKVSTRGNLGGTLAALHEAGVKTPSSPLVRSLSVHGPVVLRVEGSPRESLHVTADDLTLGVAGGTVHAKGDVDLAKNAEGKLTPGAMHAALSVRGVSLDEIGRLRGKPLPARGTVDGTVRIDGSPRAPDADLDIKVQLADNAGALTVKGSMHGGKLTAKGNLTHQSGLGMVLDIDGTQRGSTSNLHAHGSIEPGGQAPPVTLDAQATLGGPFTAAKTAPLEWKLDLDVPATRLDQLPLPPERKEKLAALNGTVAASIHAHGNRKDAFADVTLAAHGIERKERSFGAFDADLEAHLADNATTVKLVTKQRGDELPIATVDAQVGLGGRDILASLKRGVDPTLHATVDVPRRPLAQLGVAPKGDVGGRFVVEGRARDPRLHGALTAEHLVALDGNPTELHVGLDGTLDSLRAEVGSANAVALTVTVPPRTYLTASKEGGVVPVRARLHAERTPVTHVLPNLAALEPVRTLKGMLEADLEANVDLALGKDGTRALQTIELRGPVRLTEGSYAIPESSRRITGIELALAGDGEHVRIERLEAHEHDREKLDRSVHAKGALGVRDRAAEVELELRDFLVSGGNFGKHDAPRAAVTGHVSVRADLAKTPRTIDVTVAALELTSPDRFLRAHQQEAISLGDVIELQGTQVGLLQRSAPLVAASAQPTVRGEKTLEVRVHVPTAIHVKQKPLDIHAKGEVLIERYGTERELSGGLVCERGSLMVGGIEHTLDHGEVRMGKEGAVLDLHFRHDPAPAALRDFATEQGTTVYAHMVGPFGKQKVTVSGRADSLFDALAINNGGRARVLTSLDAPASQTAQLPQTREIRLTAYMAANLPHLAFMTRVNTYANPSINQFAYGRFQHFEGERYTESGKWRLKTTARSPVIGQSEGEVEYDRVFLNSPRVVSGVGLLGGTRVGGGPAVFLEWSSAD